jgi:hypothetical protein
VFVEAALVITVISLIHSPPPVFRLGETGEGTRDHVRVDAAGTRPECAVGHDVPSRRTTMAGLQRRYNPGIPDQG